MAVNVKNLHEAVCVIDKVGDWAGFYLDKAQVLFHNGAHVFKRLRAIEHGPFSHPESTLWRFA